MATSLKNLSTFETALPSAREMAVGIVVSRWNSEITNKLLEGAISTLIGAGCVEQNIIVRYVPGAFELPLATQFFAENTSVDGIIALGCVVKGDTPHFDYVCMGATQGLMNVQLNANIPVAFGLLTVDNQQQALDRTGGKYGNKGDEAAATLIEMIDLQLEMESNSDEQELLDLISSTQSDANLS